MAPRIKAARGQSIVEYVLVITVVVAALVAMRTGMGEAVTALYGSASGQVSAAAAFLRGLPLTGSGGLPVTGPAPWCDCAVHWWCC